MTFVITGCGRSGTKSISEFLDCPHEKDNALLTDPDVLQRRLDEGGPDYGECSSYLVHVASQVRVTKLAVIIRHPIRLVLSMMNRKHPSEWEKTMTVLWAQLASTESLWQLSGAKLRFERLMTDTVAQELLAHYVGRRDACVDRTMPYSNRTGEYKYNEVPPGMARQVEWFAQIFYPETAKCTRLDELEGF